LQELYFGSGTLVPPVGFDSNNNQSLAFGGTKVPLPIKVRNISELKLIHKQQWNELLEELNHEL